MTSGKEKIKENLKNNIRKYRKKLGITQSELSIRADLTQDFIQAMEAGRRKPSLDILGELADALNVEPYQLIE